MKESIIVRCPECGQWVEIPYSGAGSRFLEGLGAAYDVGENVAKKIGLSSKMQKLFGTAASFAGGATGVAWAKAAIDGAFGDAYNGSCPQCGHELSYDNDSFDETGEYNEFIEEAEQEERENSLSYMLKSRFHDDDIIPENIETIDAYIKDLEGAVESEEDAALRSDLYDILSLMYWWKDDVTTAADYIDKACEEEVDENILSPLLRAYYLSELEWEDKSKQAKIHYDELSPLINYKYRKSGYLIPLESYEKAFERCKISYVNNFLSIPPEERRFIVFSDKFDVFPEDSFYVLPLNMVPKNLSIQGDPEENELYIRHPYRSNKYFLASDYSMGIFKDKLREFKKIMVNLGAKKISLVDTYDTRRTNKSDDKIDGKIIGNLAGKGSAHLNAEHQGLSEQEQQVLYEVKVLGEFPLMSSNYPEVPKDVVWLEHDDDWKDEVTFRLENGREKATYSLTLNKSMIVSKHTQKKIEAGLKTLVGEVEAEGYMEHNIFDSTNMMHSMEFSVEFYPLSAYQKE